MAKLPFQFDLWFLYENMLRSRLFEEAVTRLWNDGRISGEMHLSIGEEAIVAGTVLQLQDGDAIALDHRGTSPLVMRGVDMVLLLREFLGQPDGLCGGKGGHMHLFSKEQLSASSGIVGASGPAAAGFALAARHLRPGTIALAARVMETGLTAKYGRVCTEETIPYSREFENQTLPNTNRIVEAALKLINVSEFL